MSVHELAAVVREMRAAQREFFTTRSRSALAKSRRLEQQVDAALQQIGRPQGVLY
jgi:hypothetical protein